MSLFLSLSLHSRQAGRAQSDSLGVTAFLSATLHAVVILGIGFQAPQFMATNTIDNTLDVVLVNQSNDLDPDEATLVSQAANQGGGTSGEDASTPIPWKQVNASEHETIALQSKSEPEVKMVSEQLLTKIGKKEFTAIVEPKKKKKESKEKKKQLTTQQQVKLEKKRLAAKINKRWQEYQKRPKREFYSPTTKKSDSASYVKKWQKKVERIGLNNFPDEIRRKKLSGTLIVDVAINADGTIRKINIIKSSDNKLLDDTTIKFIRMASPYSTFNKSMRKRIDIIHITRAYFLSGNRIVSKSVQFEN
ncbi:MAG: energy transducer TonB [Arenicella sp.]